MYRVTAIRDASIWRDVIHPGSNVTAKKNQI